LLIMALRQRGFNIIEVMVTLTVLGILVALGAPGFSDWLRAQRIRAGAEAVLNGLQVARGEAIARNLPVVFGLAPPTAGWTVCPATVSPCDPTTPAGSYIQQKSPDEGSTGVIVNQTPNASILVTFTALGAVLGSNLDGTFPVTQIDVTPSDPGQCSAAGGTMRCLRVVISPGGSVRMCDPTPGIVAPDPRVCP
jgi:type IV fimbrial biogenesis protein FimT